MGFGHNQKSKPSYTGLQLNTSSSVLPVALTGGASRMGVNLWDYVDFQAHKQKQKSGKGFGGGSGTSYTYSASPVLGLCVGEIAGIGKAWQDKGEVADYSTLGFSLFTGTMPQAPWGYMVAAHPDHARGYPGFAYLAKPNMDFGSSASMPNLNFEAFGLFYMTAAGGALPDADPALWIQDFLTDTDHGVGFPAAMLDTVALLSSADAPTTGDSAFQTWCQAMSFGISPTMVEQEAASGAIERWCTATNTAPVWTGYSLKLVPYGDEAVSGNGVTYLPPTATRFDYDDDDYQPDGDKDPVTATRSDPADAKNIVKFIIRDRANAYNDVPATFQDDNAIALYGRKEAGTITLREICETAMGAKVVALYGQRELHGRNEYRFRVGPAGDLLEPMDYGVISDPELGDDIGVYIEEIEEDEEDYLALVVRQFDGTLGAPPTLVGEGATTPATVNALAEPGPVNPPIILEPPSTLAGPTPQVWAAVSGGDGTTSAPDWGGCVVHVSTDNVTYQAVGQIDAPARMGKTTTALAAYGGANPDTVHTVGVTLLESDGELTSTSATDAAAGLTLCYQDGEFLSFQVATLTGPNAYTLGTALYRGLYGSVAGLHAIGSDFARLDENIFKFDLPLAYVGVPLWFKFQSFNIWGQQLEDLAAVTAYTYTPTGAGIAAGGGTGGGAGATVTASAAIATGKLVNIYDNAGVLSVRLADATDPAKFANAYALAPIANGDLGVVNFTGMNTSLAPAFKGEAWLSETSPGDIQSTAPASAGSIVQIVGTATPLGLAFAPGFRILI